MGEKLTVIAEQINTWDDKTKSGGAIKRGTVIDSDDYDAANVSRWEQSPRPAVRPYDAKTDADLPGAPKQAARKQSSD